MKKRGHVYHTLNNCIVDLGHFDYNKSQRDIEIELGWEACMYWSNIAHKELDNEWISVEPGDVFVDLGANIGMSATYAELKGASKIYCAEPEPNVFKALQKNKGDNWVIDNVGLSNFNGEFEMGTWPDTRHRIMAQCVTLEEFLVRNKIERIDYLKIDIEGGERDLIKSIQPDTWKLINKIFIEYHEDVYGFSDENRDDFIKTITDNGFKHHVRLGGQTMMYFWR